jgi:CubicO group peptidase (beta-lactamase class C family)
MEELNYMSIKNEMDALLQKRKFSGYGVSIRQNGRDIVRVFGGERDIAQSLPMAGNTIVRLASMTKPVIAVGAMILSDRGLLSIDDRIDRYLPEFSRMEAADKYLSFMDVYEPDPDNPLVPKFRADALMNIHVEPARKPITIEDILRHRSGMGQGPFSASILEKSDRPGMTLEERVKLFSTLPLDFQPGAFTGYSPAVAFDVLGRIIEIVSGEDLNSFIRKYICDPLEITDLGFDLTEEQLQRLSRLYESGPDGLTDATDSDHGWQLVDPLPTGYYSGSAGLLGSLDAYDRFVQMLAGKGIYGSKRILIESTVQAMTSEASGPDMFPGLFWGLGMSVRKDPQLAGSPLSAGSYGWSGAYGTHFFIDPVKALTGVMVMQVSNIGGAGSPVIPVFERCAEEEIG